MWLMTPQGFFSIVQKPWDANQGTLTVRARVSDDLDALVRQLGVDVAVADDSLADYRYRVQLPVDTVAVWLAGLAYRCDYANFKDEVKRVQGADRANAYLGVWATLLRLQPRLPWTPPEYQGEFSSQPRWWDCHIGTDDPDLIDRAYADLADHYRDDDDLGPLFALHPARDPTQTWDAVATA